MWVSLSDGLEVINLDHVERIDHDPDDGSVVVHFADGRSLTYGEPVAVERLLAAMHQLASGASAGPSGGRLRPV